MPAGTIPSSQFDSIPDSIEAFRMRKPSPAYFMSWGTPEDRKLIANLLIQAMANSSLSSMTLPAKTKQT